jgi:hypothetical protein
MMIVIMTCFSHLNIKKRCYNIEETFKHANVSLHIEFTLKNIIHCNTGT